MNHERIKLFCFPYAGGSANVYFRWKKYLNKNIVLMPVEMTGRGRRFEEPFYQSLEHATTDLFNEIYPEILDSTYVLFGHSMSSWIVFELYYKIMEKGLEPPVHIIFSGRCPPSINKKTKIYKLPDEEFIKEIKEYGGTNNELLNSKNTSAFFLPILRADYKIIENYEYKEKAEKIKCDVSVFNGLNDSKIKKEEIELWQKHCSNKIKIYTYPGGHFFILENCLSVLQDLNNITSKYLSSQLLHSVTNDQDLNADNL